MDSDKNDKGLLREKFRKLFVLAVSDNEHEADTARRKLLELRKSLGLSESDMLELMAGADEEVRSAFDAFMQGMRKPTQVLCDLAKAASIFKTKDGKAWADINVHGHRETHPVRSAAFKGWLRVRYYDDQHGAVASAEAIETAISQIEARASFEKTPTHEVYLRVAGLKDQVYLDLCDDDWGAIEVDKDGWRVVKEAPVRFQRTPGMLPLSTPPVKGGNLNALRSLVHAATENDLIILVAFLLGVLRGRGPYPVLALTGPAGAAKSTSLRILSPPGQARATRNQASGPRCQRSRVQSPLEYPLACSSEM